MFNSSEDDIFKCSYCKADFTDVIKLIPDCGESICGSCYDELKQIVDESGEYKCKLCDSAHMMMKNGLPENKGLIRAIKENRALKPLNDKLNTLHISIEELRSRITGLKTFDYKEHVDQHFDQLMIEACVAIESTHKRINELEEDLLKEIQQYRERCHEHYSGKLSTKNLETLSKGITEFSDQLTRTSTSITQQEIEDASKQTEDFNAQVKLLEEMKKSVSIDGKSVVLETDQAILQEKELLKRYIKLTEKDSRSIGGMGLEETPLTIFTNHSAVLKQVMFLSDDKKTLASCSYDGTIKIWDAEKGSEIGEIKGHTDQVHSLALLPNGWLVSGSSDKTIKIWDWQNLTEIKTFTDHTLSVVSVLTLSNGHLASLSIDNTIKIWDPLLDKDNLLLTMKGHGNKTHPRPLIQLPNGNLLTSSVDMFKYENSILRVWDLNSGKLLKSIDTGCKMLYCILGLANGQVAVGFENGTLKVIDLDDSRLTKTVEFAHGGEVVALCQLPNSNLVSCGLIDFVGADATIKIWNLLDMSVIQTINSASLFSMVISSDETDLLCGAANGNIQIWPLTKKHNSLQQ